jgi:eukaryotic-like serine/threonine-protein kinase
MTNPGDLVRKYIQSGDRIAERYEIETLVGAGAYGAIFSAIDHVTMERVAVKAVPPPRSGSDRTALGRFRREMKVIKSLRHPNIISMYHFGETEDNVAYMVMEFVDGATLLDVIAGKPMDVDVGLSVTEQIASALAEAHEKGVIHRDLKPQNIMVEESRGGYVVKVVDFGMAKLLNRLGDDSIVQLTREGIAVGTPRYIAPEQARGKQVGPYTDLYALGLLMYEILTGARAVKANDIETAIMAHVARTPLELPELDQVAVELHPIIRKLVAKKIGDRFSDAHEVVDILRRVRSGEPVHIGTAREESLWSHMPWIQGDQATAPRFSDMSAEEIRLDRDPIRAITQKLTARLSISTPKPDESVEEGGESVVSQEVDRFRTPRDTKEYLETSVALGTGVLAFLLLSAQFSDLNVALRFMLCMVPPTLSFFISFGMDSAEWDKSFVRYFLVTSVGGVVIAHVLGIQNLLVGLQTDPVWFLNVFEDVPGAFLVIDLMTNVAAFWAGIIEHL